MTKLFEPGTPVLFMKVGQHARETLDDIIARKKKEIEEAGYALWGYGGNTCHPQTMVQPFAKTYERRGQTVQIFMQPMRSSHFALPVRADEYSVDGLKWIEIPLSINVLGSRYALALTKLRKEEFDFPLNQTVVAIGNTMGRSGDKYVSGRVDKACLEVVDRLATPNTEAEPIGHIGLVADLVSPYAVYLRNRS